MLCKVFHVEMFVTSETSNVAPYEALEIVARDRDHALVRALRDHTSVAQFEARSVSTEEMAHSHRAPKYRTANAA